MQTDEYLELLIQENDELRARIDELEEALFASPKIPFEWGLTSSEARLVGCMLSRPLMTKDTAMAVLYRNDGKDEAVLKIVDVYICKARKKLTRFGIEIKTVWGQGYYIEESVRRRLVAIGGERAA